MSSVKIKVLLSSLIWSAPAGTIAADNQPPREKDIMGILVAKNGPDELAVYAQTTGQWVRLNADQWAACFVEPMPDTVPFKLDTPGWAIITGLTNKLKDTEGLRYDLFSMQDLDYALGRHAYAGLWPWFKIIKEPAFRATRRRDIEVQPSTTVGCKPTVRVKPTDQFRNRRHRQRVI